MTDLLFRERPARSDYRPIVKNVLNALDESGSLVLVGTMDDATYAAFVAQFASDKGATIIRENATATAMRGAIERGAKSLKKTRPKFAPLEIHNGDTWNVVAYRVTR